MWRILFNGFFMFFLLQMVACRTAHPVDSSLTPPMRIYTPDKNVQGMEVKDSIEGFNRHVYKFNYRFDKYIFLPIVRVYRFILPDYVEDRVADFFNNMGEFGNLYNNVLQADWKDSGVTLGRFSINTTVGILGFWDPAAKWGMKERNEDFGQTLGRWGIGSGSYLVIPVVGPSNIRDGVGMGADVAVVSTVGPVSWMNSPVIYWAFTGVSPIDRRKRVAFRYRETGSPFEYDLVRMFYTIKRNVNVKE
jgi:phospholipid-binding lipoprotein MlaA